MALPLATIGIKAQPPATAPLPTDNVKAPDWAWFGYNVPPVFPKLTSPLNAFGSTGPIADLTSFSLIFIMILKLSVCISQFSAYWLSHDSSIPCRNPDRPEGKRIPLSSDEISRNKGRGVLVFILGFNLSDCK